MSEQAPAPANSPAKNDAPRTNSAGRFAHIDGMRAFAVMLVVVAHAGAGGIVPGGSGVTIFFAISGFIITYLVLRERDRTDGFSVRGFYFRRAAKIVPPFIVAVLVPSLIWAIWNPIDWWALAAEVFFFFNWVKMSTGYLVMPGTGVVWSLSIEEQFYLVFAVLWLLIVGLRRWRAVLASVAALALIASVTARFVLAAFPGTEERIYYGTDTRMGGIALGVLAAVLLHLWMQQGSPSTWWSRVIGSDAAFVGALALYLASLLIRDEWFRDTFRFLFQSVAASIVILYGFMGRRTRLKTFFQAASAWRPVALIGLASYSIYLIHLTAIDAVSPLFVSWPVWASVIVLATFGTGIGIAIYYAVEVPVLRWRHRRERVISR
ncbi:hypothetical protein GCM10009808_00070 [Microbacterium sediminicola]|uniref:Acyltransferase 3 domain-containing protein n=1 Tax=Microbacterium sediminicola TaxID=415210 RepID=A0ABP4TF05_9MICO